MSKRGTNPESNKYKGIYWAESSKKFKSGIQIRGTVYHCGLWPTALEAVKARDRFIIRMGFDHKLLQVIKPMIKENV